MKQRSGMMRISFAIEARMEFHDLQGQIGELATGFRLALGADGSSDVIAEDLEPKKK